MSSIIERKYQDLSLSWNLSMHNYEKVVWVLGDGRSGTTWLFDLLNYDDRLRKMFEPVHPVHVEPAAFLPLNKYLPCDSNDPKIFELFEKIFSGRLRNPWVDKYVNKRFFHQGLLIKDIFANLLVGWANNNFPGVKKIIIIRNPIPVALSKRKKKGWVWMEDPKEFLRQDRLVKDHLGPFQPLIESIEDDFISRQVLNWAIIHYVPFRQLSWADAWFVFYEDLYLDPRQEMGKIFAWLGDEKNLDSRKFLERVGRPTRVSGGESNLLKDTSPVTHWETEVSPEVRQRCYEILRRFGLEGIYGRDFREPNRAELKKTVDSLG